MSNNELVEVNNLFKVHETANAICFEDRAGDNVWIPRGQISYMKTEKTGRVNIKLAEWLAKAKNLDYDS